ncbi:MAG TPA: response regulator [Bryobacteraceae bacterium]|nr:response regulator [Bryobacteraceae bacterium]
MSRKRVLICDDEPAICESVSFIVDQEGYEAVTAEDGDEGLRLIRTSAPDLVLLDVMMPGMTGFELCREIKSHEATRDIYVILLTAAGQERDRTDGYASGADEYMTKPFSPRMLRQRLHELLDGSP